MAYKTGTPRADFIAGTAYYDNLNGGAGNDVIFGYAAPPKATSYIDAIFASRDSADYIDAGSGDDKVFAGGGSDTVIGGSGRDTIDGGPGADHLWGGAGADVFVFRVLETAPGSPILSGGIGAYARDVIEDFRHGTDKIDLTGWENYQHPGATFLGQEPITEFSPALQVSFRYEGGNTVIDLARTFYEPDPTIQYDYHGPQAQIALTGHHIVTDSDFIF